MITQKKKIYSYRQEHCLLINNVIWEGIESEVLILSSKGCVLDVAIQTTPVTVQTLVTF